MVELEEEDVTDVDSNLSNGGNVDTDFISYHVNEISQANVDLDSGKQALDDDDILDSLTVNESESSENFSFFDEGDSSAAYCQFKELLH